MSSERDTYQNPLTRRYASREMSACFSDRKKFTTWRRLWVALAEAEQELGLRVTDEQIAELRRFQDDVNFDVADARERQIRHDVMAHVHAYGVQCPTARPIIHLGATSAYVGDNTDLIQMRDGLLILKKKLVTLMAELRAFALAHKDLATLGFTHFQAAQPTTVGKRATLWLQDFLLDYQEVEHRLATLRLLGSKGTTGTQASFVELFDGDEEKVKALDRKVAEKMGFGRTYSVTGQTAPRKVDAQVAGVLAGVAASGHKFGDDLRLLQHLKEVEEPFEEEQVGSSAMAYKRNPMRSERVCALARYAASLAQSTVWTAATQWFERTLDDSANKRLAVPEMFMAADAILILAINVARGLVVHPRMIRRHIDLELPFMATENILMEAVKRGGDRQSLHERIRQHAVAAGRVVKEEGGDNDLLDRIAADPAFGVTRADLDRTLDLRAFVGRAPSQVVEFIRDEVDPIIEANRDLLGAEAEVKV
ncbi:MAG: adenylosuccinate lyase [Candidatus Handelsmanbacteria bacterium RIFCSPLOWO2_12_FULL_64_10]|uniref:Adenylosuccinate lyase n=1 Tax=Handelsmanbacteria sp. (strain RIFCSPLOWO2_12_FULL_64_10) TaxID=1817868 RepID=A0A1F6D653_HANXR|nr:MAG: adenylosuccinate lyase [Candidatus Handelsmanbacteria bacterium RIFCSPLOWO2_12_FULL_64_10]